MTLTTSPRLRFWNHVVRDPDCECWLWFGATSKGYALFKIAGRSTSVHRFAYEEFVGPIPEGLQIDHLCRTRCCVNPSHLEPVTNAENNRRSPLTGSVSARRAREGLRNRPRTDIRGPVCKNGHLLADVGDYVYPSGVHYCAACKRAAHRRARRKVVVA